MRKFKPCDLVSERKGCRQMDVISHGLWTAVAAKKSRQLRPHLSVGWTAFWGIFPDLFSFAIPAVVRLWWYATGTTHTLLPQANSPQHFQFVWQLYHCSHSLLVFAAIFGIVWAVRGKPSFELCGWLLHILIDVVTHQGIFAIRFLWPVSSWSVKGIRWENPWFLGVNYAALLGILGWMWWRSRSDTRSQAD